MFRYLVILDDVWRSAAWECLRSAFPDDGKGSRIVVTTRIDEVARSCSSSDGIYRMKTLGEEDSKKLLFKTVFRTEQWPSTNYDDYKAVCEAILKKCGGLPLAIVSIGGMLAQRRNEPAAKWQTVINRLPSELETNSTLEGMARILSLGYNDLPYHLKACFLYLSVFPEDHEIRRGPLVRRWTAEGFISARNGLSVDEIAQSCFDGFASRGIVIPEQLASSSEVRSFKVHDIMLDVITSKSVRENFISFLGNPRHDTENYGKIRRLSIQPGATNKDFSLSLLSHVRSLTIMRSSEKPVAITFKNLTLLRMLDLEGCRWLRNEDLKDICKLSLLRYLSLRDTPISQLPAMIGKLKGLVTLDMRQTLVKDLPDSIKWLQNLKHLLAGGYRHYTRSHSVKHFDYETAVMIQSDFSKMRALQRISFINVERSPHALHEVEKLTQLTRLCVMQMNHDATWEPFGDSLSKLSSSLRYLSIMQYAKKSNQLSFLHHLRSPPQLLQSLHLMGSLRVLPKWVSSLQNLGSLSLRETYLKQKTIRAVLGKLPSLVSLKLYRLSYTGSKLIFEKGRFLNLKQLVVDYIEALHEISFQQGGAPVLERFSLALGSRKRQIVGIENLKQLKKMELYGDINDEEVKALTTLVSSKHPANPPKVTREDQFTET
jgi:disease resistance protein RPM1